MCWPEVRRVGIPVAAIHRPNRLKHTSVVTTLVVVDVLVVVVVAVSVDVGAVRVLVTVDVSVVTDNAGVEVSKRMISI